MNRLFLLFLLLVCVCTLSACATVQVNVELSGEREDIASIELYSVQTLYTEENVSALREENQPVSSLDEASYDAFLDRLVSLPFEEERIYLPIPMDGGCNVEGYVICVVYQDGRYDLIASGGQLAHRLGKDGSGRYNYGIANYTGQESWDSFVEAFFPAEG